MSLSEQFVESERRRKEAEKRVQTIKEQQLSKDETSKELAKLRQLLQTEIESRKAHRQAEKETLAKINKYLDNYT